MKATWSSARPSTLAVVLIEDDLLMSATSYSLKWAGTQPRMTGWQAILIKLHA
jgi:hypothetical protein